MEVYNYNRTGCVCACRLYVLKHSRTFWCYYEIKQGLIFRYVLHGNPAGTHWYHSHTLYQKDQGIVGALIVRDKKTEKTLPKDVIDDQSKTVFAVGDGTISPTEGVNTQKSSLFCEPDNSRFPLDFSVFRQVASNPVLLSINGVQLGENINAKTGPTFYVERGKKYRFRLVGTMLIHVLRFSIDKHKLNVVATDGYLTKSFATDILIFHVAERYDFVLETSTSYPAGTRFPIRIETVAVDCGDSITPKGIGYAFIEYTDGGVPHGSKTVIDRGGFRYCQNAGCHALNCPFKDYPPKANINCYKVTDLQLLNPTPKQDLPTKRQFKVFERFFNFKVSSKGALINGIKNELPANVPFVHKDEKIKVKNECPYNKITTCDASCAHSVYLQKIGRHGKNQRFIPYVAQFMLSSLEKSTSNVKNIVTHPIHVHGHSYFVAKIAYPTYNKDGTIKELNKDITVPDCGHGKWTHGEPSDIFVNQTTVRKDTIIVPAGGYVVIRLMVTNPGWWFMHCHIDYHLNDGMAIAISELPPCQNPPENSKYIVGQSFGTSKRRFELYGLDGNKCGIK